MRRGDQDLARSASSACHLVSRLVGIGIPFYGYVVNPSWFGIMLGQLDNDIEDLGAARNCCKQHLTNALSVAKF